MPTEKSVLIKIAVDFIIVATVGFPILIFFLIGQPKERGFFCDDDSIRYPFKESTISNNLLYVFGIFVPVITMCITEYCNDVKNKRDTRGQILVLFQRPIPALAWKLYIRVGVFLFGACVSQLTTDIAKYSIGRLRPHFMDVCKPDVDCATVIDPHTYIIEFECKGDNPVRIREARLSFPSGHSSFSAYTMVYLVIYLQACMNCNFNKLLRPFLQFLFISVTWYTALSRIGDYKHHWSDVLIGFLLGTIVALIVTTFVSDLFTTPPKEEDDGASRSTVGVTPVTNYNTIDLEQQ